MADLSEEELRSRDQRAIEELRSRYQTEWNRTERLEDKAKNVISSAGTFTSLIFGFVTLSASIFKFGFPFPLALTIGISIIASILAILISVLALGLEKHSNTFTFDILKDIQNDKWRMLSDKGMLSDKDVIRTYANIILQNNHRNNKKAGKVKCAIWLLFSSIVLIGITTGISLYLFQNKPSGPILTIPIGASIQGHISYEPVQINVIKGDTIKVQNKDSFIHTVTSGKGVNDTNAGKLFNTGIIKPGDSVDIVIANLIPGEYSFFCAVHPHMAGILKVIDLNMVNDISR